MSEQSNEEALEERLFKRLSRKVHDENAEMMRSSTSINASNDTWFCFGSDDGAVATNTPSDDDPAVFQLSQDLYAILATASWKSLPFWLAFLVIFGFQYLLVILLLANQIDMDPENPLNLPPNVDPSVRTSQVMLIIIALFSQGDLLAGIESLVSGLPDVFRGNRRFAGMTSLQWRLSSIARFTQGLLNLLASFVLAIQSETVPDVLLNVLGVAFISDLDELAFRLCLKGYFGGSMKVMSNDVSAVHFHRSTPNIRKSIPMAQRKIKKDAHIISAFAIFLVALIFFSYLAIKQNSGGYLEQDIRIEFGDEVLSYLGLFNGCYQTSESGGHIGGRLVYEQVGYPNGGKFGFCSDFGEGDGGWAFVIGEVPSDICNSYILRSGETKTFSLLDAGGTKWYTANDLPMDYLEITETKTPSTECGQSLFAESSKHACPSILAFNTIPMKSLSPPLADVDTISENGLDAAVSHPIYYSSSNENDRSFTLIFFTGRRWIRTESDRIRGLGNKTSVLDIENFFVFNNGLFKVIDQLRASVDEEALLASAVSETVDMARDQGSPLGLLWYFPRYEQTEDPTEMGNLLSNFPSPNLARPIDLDWMCLVCNDQNNPCFHGGSCDADSGVCVSCDHGTTGDLCQVLPTGNGICNLYFNTAEFNYDGGDCCAGTCKGRDCGKDDLSDPFPSAILVSHLHWLYHFQNTTEEWKDSFRAQEFAYSVPINEESLFFAQPFPLRFSHCIDPNTALLTIEQKPPPSYWRVGKMGLASTKVRCDGLLYLQTPEFEISNRSNYILKEEVRVPYGARCEFWLRSAHSDYNVSIFAESQSMPFLHKQIRLDHDSVILRIPESDCVWSAFAKHLIPPSFTTSEFDEFTGGVDLERMCKRDTAELLERYTLWKLSKSAAAVGRLLLRNFDGHICDISWNSWTLECSDDSSRRVVGFVVDWFGNELLSEIGSFAQLTALHVSENNDLTSLPTAISKLPLLRYLDLMNNLLTSLFTEIGSLTSLIELDLTNNKLNYLPSEIGSLTSLTELDLTDNQLNSLPSEIGSLTSLIELDLFGNKLSSLPPEIGSLTSLTGLDLEGNKMNSLPLEIASLTSLSFLALSGNELKFLPSEIGTLRLRALDLDDNQLTRIPSEIGSLTALQYFEIAGNELNSLPSEIGMLTELTLLRLNDNQLSSVPSEIGNLGLLATLALSDNPMTWNSLPIEVKNLESDGTLDIDVCDDLAEDGSCLL